MFCGKCGKMVQDGNKFCTGCGTKILPIVIKNSVEKNDNSSFIPQNNPVVNNTNTIDNNFNYTNTNNYYKNNIKKVNINDKSNFGYNVLAFFIPIVGLILFFVMKNETPKKAKAIGISALIGYIVSIIFSILYLAFIVIITFTTLEFDYDKNKWDDSNYEYNDYEYDFERNYNFDENYNI